ncbi:12320_t:CDS:2 [Acaulospora colombiana]|uniref:12320_t:CDS:1 n=1 Tax=Acaulospora colombiana TaxID=27376 RepID=A0ACA9JX96_9GLOM|nr:12320_t:CDS:2 [Acaulospora colombiana]
MAIPPLLIKIVNTLAFVFLLGLNTYAGFFDNDSPYHETHVTYITPAAFVYFIWVLIHFLLLGFVIYQFFPAANEVVVDGIHGHFLSLSVFNAIWVWLYSTDHTILALIPLLLVSGQVSYVYFIIKNRYPAATFGETVWIHAPFSLYHGWIFVLTVIGVFVAFSPEKVDDESPNVLTKIFVVLGLLFLEGTAVAYIEKYKGDIAGAIVIAWSLFGIAAEQDDPVIHWAAIILAVFTTIHIFKPLFKKYVLKTREEQAPLIP